MTRLMWILLLLSPAAQACTLSTTLSDVQMHAGVGALTHQRTTQARVTCPAGTPYSIEATSQAGQVEMSGPYPIVLTIEYEHGQTIDALGVAGEGTGEEQVVPLITRLELERLPPVGTYTAVISIGISF